MTKTTWLWDRPGMTGRKVKEILKDDKNPRFLLYASLLMSRNGDPDYVFNFLSKKDFCQYWPLIKEKIDRADWFSPYRSDYWQPVYERALEELRTHHVRIHRFAKVPVPPQRFKFARMVRKMRKKAGYTQKHFALLLGVKQQYVSQLETGRINPSLDMIGQIANVLARDLRIQFN